MDNESNKEIFIVSKDGIDRMFYILSSIFSIFHPHLDTRC